MTAADALERADRRAFLLRHLIVGLERLLVVTAFIVTFVSGVIVGGKRASVAVAPVAITVAPSHPERSVAPVGQSARFSKVARAKPRKRASRPSRVILRSAPDIAPPSLSLPELHVLESRPPAIAPIAVHAVALPVSDVRPPPRAPAHRTHARLITGAVTTLAGVVAFLSLAK